MNNLSPAPRGHKKTGLPARQPGLRFLDPGDPAIHICGPEAFRPPVTRSLAFSGITLPGIYATKVPMRPKTLALRY